MPSARVLVVDDDEVIAQSTAEYFNMFEVQTEYVTGYDAAVEYLDTHTVSLVLLDVNLGEQSGFELCKRIREKYDMPILFISARTSDAKYSSLIYDTPFAKIRMIDELPGYIVFLGETGQEIAIGN